jgi:hypothetical protein
MSTYHEDPMLNAVIEETHEAFEAQGMKFVTHRDPEEDGHRHEMWAQATRVGPLVIDVTYPRLRDPDPWKGTR